VKAIDFDAFFHAVHGHTPFPWQSRLAHEVCETNVWPSVLDLPTGSGKTSCIDVALFHWLVSASRGSPADAARRVAFVVDRRIIVDEATERAAKIASAVACAKHGILDEARGLLHERAGDSKISVFTLRGGVARERNLVRDPLRVTVVLSTVDQIGSRLLFRGYGVSDARAREGEGEGEGEGKKEVLGPIGGDAEVGAVDRKRCVVDELEIFASGA